MRKLLLRQAGVLGCSFKDGLGASLNIENAREKQELAALARRYPILTVHALRAGDIAKFDEVRLKIEVD